MRTLRRQQDEMDEPTICHLPKLAWVKLNTPQYVQAILDINESYRKMIEIGKAVEVFRETKDDVSNMLKAKSEEEFNAAKQNIDRRYNYHRNLGYPVLQNFNVDAQLIPIPKLHSLDKCPTKRQIIVKEQILQFEHNLADLNIYKCSDCLECHIEQRRGIMRSGRIASDGDAVDYICKKCKTRNDPEYFLRNNMHPVWYLKNNDGTDMRDENGKKVPQYHIPQELECLSMAEKLLIRRCANFVPTVHLRNGVCAIKGHAVTFPQNITEMCNELPQRKETIVTFIRNIGNANTTDAFPTSLRVNRDKVLTALRWLKKHNKFYQSIIIKEDNLDWMGTRSEVNICEESIKVNVKETSRSCMESTEEEHISTAHDTNPDGDHLPISTIHANKAPLMPSGKSAEPIQELISKAHETNQSAKVMNFPPIDHDSPIS